ncbi:MAG: cysteine desulfurase family protein [Planctomycetota bacterium]
MIYLDHHATTPCDQRVVEAMLPFLNHHFGNPHSDSHVMGRDAADAIDDALKTLEQLLNAPAGSVLITSGATESINLALRGTLTHPRCRHRRLITVATEHPAVLDVADDLRSDGIDVHIIETHGHEHSQCGSPDLDQLAEALQTPTSLVSVMWANNEIGTIAPITDIAAMVHDAGALLHCDATQAVGRLAVDVKASDIDLLTASAHKFYGPKGVGILVAGNGNRRVRLRPQIVGGGQQRGLRSGTMNPMSVVGMAKALQLTTEDIAIEDDRIRTLRNRLWKQLAAEIDGLILNGPDLDNGHRLAGNLNFRLPDVEGETWMTATPEVAMSSGSACASVDALPSHVLTSLGLSESEARRSVRFGIGRPNQLGDIDSAASLLAESYHRLRSRV